MKNINIGLKLILVGIIVLILPIAALGFISIIESSVGLEGLVQEQLEKRTKEIADSIYNVLDTEKKLAVDFAGREEAVDALGNKDRYTDTEERYRELNRILAGVSRNKALTEDYESINYMDANGILVASTSPENIGLDLSDREYLVNALKGIVNIGPPAISRATNEPFFAVAAPVNTPDGKIVGAAVLIVDLGFLWDIIKESTIAQTGYTFVTDRNGLVISHPDPSLIFEINMGDLDGMGRITERFKNGESGFEKYVFNDVPKTAGFAPVPETAWGVFLTVTDEEFMQPVYNVIRAVIIVAAIGFLVAFIIFLVFSRSLTIPIRLGVKFAQEISEGKLNADIDVNRKDEIGMLADALRNMKDKLREVVENVYNTSIQVTEGSRQLAQSAEQLSQGATEQAANAEEVSSSVEQMGANIQQNTDNSAQTEKISVQAAKDAEEGGAAVMDAVEAMNAIAEKINIVGEIARQTNLLSLNAAIEAARAGEHGKGFAVVANEVGKLASVSQEAASDILDIAKTSVNKANTAGEKIKAIIPDIRRTADLVQEISASSNEQNAGAEQINQAMLQLDQVIQQNAASAEEASAMSEELTSQAEQLRDMISFFKIDRMGMKNSGKQHSSGKPPESGGMRKPEPRKIQQKPMNVQKLEKPVPETREIDQKRIAPPPKPASDEPHPDELDSDFIEF